MASTMVLETQKARAIAETIETTAGLIGENSERLYSAKHDIVGSTLPDYVLAMVLAELVRVVASQQERIEELEAAAKKSGK